jgi:hypothetical protein
VPTLRRYGLIIVDEVGYLPFEQDAANLFCQLVSSRYEHASLILTSNLPFSGWGRAYALKEVALNERALSALTEWLGAYGHYSGLHHLRIAVHLGHDDWALMERERLRQRTLHALDALSRCL